MCVNINNTQNRQFQLQFTHVLVVVREAKTFSQMREFEFGSQLCLNTSGEGCCAKQPYFMGGEGKRKGGIERGRGIEGGREGGK